MTATTSKAFVNTTKSAVLRLKVLRVACCRDASRAENDTCASTTWVRSDSTSRRRQYMACSRSVSAAFFLGLSAFAVAFPAQVDFRLWVAISTPSPITTIRAIGKPKEPNCMCYSMFFGSYFAILGLGYHTASAPCLLRAAVG